MDQWNDDDSQNSDRRIQNNFVINKGEEKTMKQLKHEREKITQDLDLIEQELAEREGLREDNAESLDNGQERVVPLRFYKGEEESVDNIMVEMMNEMNNNSAMAKNDSFDSESSRE